jgi:hypothetical protein
VAQKLVDVLDVRGVAAVYKMSKVTQLLAYFAVGLYIPSVCAEPCWGGEGAVEHGEE